MRLSLPMMQAFPSIYGIFLLSLLEGDNEQFQALGQQHVREEGAGKCSKSSSLIKTGSEDCQHPTDGRRTEQVTRQRLRCSVMERGNERKCVESNMPAETMRY